MNVLIRGLSPRVHRLVRIEAEAEDRSVNQVFLLIVSSYFESKKNNGRTEHRHEEAFRRLEELREKIRKKYGRQEDSTLLIREDRDSR